jgi:hypothetical protein
LVAGVRVEARDSLLGLAGAHVNAPAATAIPRCLPHFRFPKLLRTIWEKFDFLGDDAVAIRPAEKLPVASEGGGSDGEQRENEVLHGFRLSPIPPTASKSFAENAAHLTDVNLCHRAP